VPWSGNVRRDDEAPNTNSGRAGWPVGNIGDTGKAIAYRSVDRPGVVPLLTSQLLAFLSYASIMKWTIDDEDVASAVKSQAARQIKRSRPPAKHRTVAGVHQPSTSASAVNASRRKWFESAT
jgi:hypothetical protein